MNKIKTTFVAAALFFGSAFVAGCVTATPEGQAMNDGKITRGMIDSMTSSVNSYPASMAR